MLTLTITVICSGMWLVEGLIPPNWPASCSFNWRKNVSDVMGGENGVTTGITYFSRNGKSYRFDKTGDVGIIFIFPVEGRVYLLNPNSCVFVNVNKFDRTKEIPNPLPSLAGYSKNASFSGPGDKWEFHLEFKGMRLNNTILLKYVNQEPIPISAEYKTTAIADPNYPGRFDAREYYNYSSEEPNLSVWFLNKNRCKLTKQPTEIAKILKTARFRNAPASTINAEPENW